MRSSSGILCFTFAFIFLISCRPDDSKQFTKLDPGDTGIEFINNNHETERSNIFTYEYFYNGGGVAVGDINNDGLTDIYFSSNLFSNKLYLNQGNFRFKDITENSGTACEVGWKTGVTMVDINADGLLDIYVCRSASPDPERRRNMLLINNGDLTFSDKAKEFNLDDPSYSTQAAFFDFDNDNDLDAMLLNHSLLEISNSYNITVKNSETRFPDVGNKLYRNDGGLFTDVSDSIGVYGPAFNYGLGLSLSDLNNDGWIDMYTGCDYTGRDKLLINEQGKRFRDVTTDQLSHISKFTMGTDIADINGDGLMDIFTLDMLPEGNYRQKQLMGSDRYDVYSTMVKNGLHAQYMRNMLHLNNGDGTFSEIGQLAGVSNTDWSWASLFADFDNDGVQDLFVTNGFKRDLTDNDFAKFKAFQEIVDARKQGKQVSFLQVISKFTENRIPNYIFKGNGDLTFSNQTEAWGFNDPSLSNGAAYADLDNDGDLDLVINNINEQAGVYRNNTEKNKNHFLSVQLIGEAQNRSAVGAKVRIIAKRKQWVREHFPVRGFQSSVEPVLHFGLGAVNTVDSIIIRWPDGESKVITNVAVDQKLLIKQADGVALKEFSAGTQPLFSELENTISFSHQENNFIDFRIQALLPRMYSTEGPAMAKADINGDGLTDLYVGGAKGYYGVVFRQDKNGGFKKTEQPALTERGEATDAVFFDIDNDNDQDLYIVNGGYEFAANDADLRDLLLENDGKGNFRKKALPDFFASGSCVRPHDIDGDGDLDLFVGGRVIPGRYPETPESYILINDGKGIYTLATSLPSGLSFCGMVTDAVWTDLNNDRQDDLIVVGEWMPIKVFINTDGKFTDKSSLYVKEKTEGLWNCILSEDFDQDGDKDFVFGNYGLNNQWKVSEERPASLVYADFDNNGSIDPVLNYFVGDRSYPYPTRDELTEQVPSFKKRFNNYRSYADATIEDVLLDTELSAAKKLQAYMLETIYVENSSEGFKFRRMPVELQFAPVCSLVAMDVNKDGKPDFVSGGNLSATRSRTGKLTGNTGFIFLGNGKGDFTFLHPGKTGLGVKGDVRKMLTDKNKLFIGINNAQLLVYDLN